MLHSASNRGGLSGFCPGAFAAPEDMSPTATNAGSVCAMRLLVKFNVILGLVLITGLFVTALVARSDLDYSARQQVSAQARLMMAAADATRQYTNEEIATMLKELNGPHNKFYKQEVPAYAA